MAIILQQSVCVKRPACLPYRFIEAGTVHPALCGRPGDASVDFQPPICYNFTNTGERRTDDFMKKGDKWDRKKSKKSESVLPLAEGVFRKCSGHISITAWKAA
jgi:hypothetical protein